MHEKYDLDRMLDEIKVDEGEIASPVKKLSQDEIRKLVAKKKKRPKRDKA